MHNFFLLNYLEIESDSILLLCVQKKALTGVKYPSLIPRDRTLPTEQALSSLQVFKVCWGEQPFTVCSRDSQHINPISSSLQHSKHQVTFLVISPKPEPVPHSCLASWWCSEHMLGFLARPEPPPKGRDPQFAWPGCREYALFHVLNA